MEQLGAADGLRVLICARPLSATRFEAWAGLLWLARSLRESGGHVVRIGTLAESPLHRYR